jgi:choline dehydrogenase-like flavoprotein
MAVGVEYCIMAGLSGQWPTVKSSCARVRLTRRVSLMLSGIGPEPELAKHGIPVNLASLDVGANLQDHREQGCRRRSKTGIRPAIAYNSIAWLITSSRPEV